RPDYATTVYSKILKTLYPEIPIVLGGIEASLRRVTHYDYWSDQLKPSILVDSKADLLVYGMGEQPMRSIIKLLQKGVPFSALTTIPQTVHLLSKSTHLPKTKRWETFELASHQLCQQDKKVFARNFKYIEQESNKPSARRLVQEVGESKLVINPPFATMTEKEIDASFDLPYTRLPHPKYGKRGLIPAYEMIRHSINLHRGCFGGCSFCTISAHQGKFIASRSKISILREVQQITQMSDFKGYISDLGGPSANMYRMQGIDQSICDICVKPSCIHPTICSNLSIDHSPLIDIYRSVATHPKVKKAFVTSGIRYDLLVAASPRTDKINHSLEYTEQLVREHVSGRLKVAPEHTSERVLKVMRKPSFKYFKRFKTLFERFSDAANLDLQLIPYFISSHPGSELEDMAKLACETRQLGFKLEQVQDFTPTPMTLSTVIYYSGYHPYSLKKVYTARTKDEKQDQNRFFFWYKSENRGWIRRTLKRLNKSRLADQLLSASSR
ncbi:MAG: YgiQ family radical SAM protein, partial [Candidatus Marinimicrobia bacterium]|nr:YgiQ family radical SAM protein [Candidatus Neomarinimicrobiota bacterium]